MKAIVLVCAVLCLVCKCLFLFSSFSFLFFSPPFDLFSTIFLLIFIYLCEGLSFSQTPPPKPLWPPEFNCSFGLNIASSGMIIIKET